jgi:hypothetical protein
MILRKGKYLIEKNYVLKAIAKFIFEKRRYERLSDEVIFGAISSVKWENDFTIGNNIMLFRLRQET